MQDSIRNGNNQQFLTLEQARRVPWVQGKGPIGELLDSGAIGRKDLEWAREKAYRQDQREAAHVLLQQLDEQTANQIELVDGEVPRYGPRVIIGSGYLEEQQELHWGMVGMLLGFALSGLALYIPRLVGAILRHELVMASITLLVGLIFYFMVWQYLKREMKAYRTYQTGRRGEEHMLELIRSHLDHHWTIFRNLKLPERKSDIDLVLVGPGGVWVVEIKSFKGTIRVRDTVWEYQKGGSWLPFEPRRNPAAQVKGNAAVLNDFLQRQGIKRWVETAVALAEPQPIGNLEEAALPVWTHYNVSHVARLTTQQRPVQAELESIVTVLTKVADLQRTLEARAQHPRSQVRGPD